MCPDCPNCRASGSHVVRNGHFFRKSDSRKIQNFVCRNCRRYFSSATFSDCYRQKKRRINSTVRFCFGSNMCPRDIAELVGVNIKTIAARLIWQAALSRIKNKHYMRAYLQQYGRIDAVQFDDLITFEHTKCKPLTVPMAVIDGKRVPLGFQVASIPAFGRLAAIARAKYGKRDDLSRPARRALFEELQQFFARGCDVYN